MRSDVWLAMTQWGQLFAHHLGVGASCRRWPTQWLVFISPKLLRPVIYIHLFMYGNVSLFLSMSILAGGVVVERWGRSVVGFFPDVYCHWGWPRKHEHPSLWLNLNWHTIQHYSTGASLPCSTTITRIGNTRVIHACIIHTTSPRNDKKQWKEKKKTLAMPLL